MSRNTLERIPESPRDALRDFEEDLLNLTPQKKKWFQFKTVGKYFSGLVDWLPGSVSQAISDASQFLSSESPNPPLRDFIVYGSIALLITTFIITTSILTMGLGPLIMAGGALSAAGIISAIVVVALTVSAIWGGIGAAWQGFIRYLDENWSNVPEEKYPLPIEDNIVGQEPDGPIPGTYALVPNLPVTAPVPVPVPAEPRSHDAMENLEQRVRVWEQHKGIWGTSSPEQPVAHQKNQNSEVTSRNTW